MGFTPRAGGSKGGKKFGGPPPWKKRGGADTERSMLFPATCATCGKDCQVPFKPNGRKPVLCSNCFETDGPSESRHFDHRKPERAESSLADAQLKSIHVKLDAILKILNDATL